MRKPIRNLVAISAMTLPLAVGATSAFAATDAGQHSAGVQHGSSILGNGSIAPVTQINPAINVGNLLGGDQGRHHYGSTSKDKGKTNVTQHNGVNSSTNQANTDTSEQHQSVTGVQTGSTSGKHRSGLLQGLLGGQSGKSAQGNGNVAPITQINPAINIGNLLGGSEGRHHKSTEKTSIAQHNSVTSSTTQVNTSTTTGDQNVTGTQSR